MLRIIELFETGTWHDLTVISGGTLIVGRAMLDAEAEALSFPRAGMLLGGAVVSHAKDVCVPLDRIDAWHPGSADLSFLSNPKISISL